MRAWLTVAGTLVVAGLIALFVLLALLTPAFDGGDESSVATNTTAESPCWEIDWERLGAEGPLATPTYEPADEGQPPVVFCTPVPEE